MSIRYPSFALEQHDAIIIIFFFFMIFGRTVSFFLCANEPGRGRSGRVCKGADCFGGFIFVGGEEVIQACFIHSLF